MEFFFFGLFQNGRFFRFLFDLLVLFSFKGGGEGERGEGLG